MSNCVKLQYFCLKLAKINKIAHFLTEKDVKMLFHTKIIHTIMYEFQKIYSISPRKIILAQVNGIIIMGETYDS